MEIGRDCNSAGSSTPVVDRNVMGDMNKISNVLCTSKVYIYKEWAQLQHALMFLGYNLISLCLDGQWNYQGHSFSPTN